jgi:hypothetical protein
MKYNYDITTSETLLQKVVEAVKEGKEYVPNSLRQFGKRYVFEMEDDKQVENVESVTVADNGSTGEEFNKALDSSVVPPDLSTFTKAELVKYLEDNGQEVDSSKLKADIYDQAVKFQEKE